MEEKNKDPKGLTEKVFKTKLGEKELTFKTGKMARLADGAVFASYGDTQVLATAVVSEKPREDVDFLPLLIEFEEKWYASGKISGSRFVKREGKATESAVLRARLIDRPIRPLFPKGFYNDVQIVVTVLSADLENDPGILGLNAASTALMLSGIPFEGPIGAVRVGHTNGKFVANPTSEEMSKSDLDLVVAGTKEAISMVEAGANQLSESKMVEALEFGHKALRDSIDLQEQMAKEFGIEKKEYKLVAVEPEIYQAIDKFLIGKLGGAIRHADMNTRQIAISELEEDVMEEFGDGYEEEQISAAFEKLIKEEVRRAILDEDERPDGRKFDEVRPVSCEVGLLKRTHGSALFTRGQTQALTVTTLGSPSKAQIVESMDQDLTKSYIHHYNFPPYSTGEVRPMRGPGRRDVGHGALAERAIMPVLPAKEEFPYAIRVVSEILSSNGSTSMASTCGSTLSLMDAGVPIKAPVSGIAMGLVSRDGDIKKGYKILTDIQGAEDFAGDMDFKVAGTKDGITALQMDMKVRGLSIDVLKEAMEKAKTARLFILDKMLAIIEKPRAEISKYAPRLTTIHINPEKIREVIGKGGEVINKIIAETGAEIDIEDDGTIIIASVDEAASKAAVKMIQDIVKEPEPGDIYEAKVVKIMDFGAFVEFLPGKEGLVHISQLADHRVEKVEDEVKVGEVIRVKLVKVDELGRYNLSRSAVKDHG